jgi:hypothetical protein
MEDSFPFERPAKKKRKIDYAALNSSLARIPGMDLETVRDLIDSGISQPENLVGRAPEVLFEEILARKPGTTRMRLFALRLAVYYAETPEPDPARLKPWVWMD